MKRFVFALALLTLLASPAWAQMEGVMKGQWELSAGGGVSLPIGDFGDVATTGFLFGGNVAYYFDARKAIGVEFNYHMYPADDLLVEATRIITGDPAADLDWSEIQFTIYGKYLFMPRNFTPYLKAGGGLYSLGLKLKALGLEDSDSQSDAGITAGLGMQFKGQGNVGGFVEVNLHSVFTEGSSTNFVDAKGGIVFFVGGK